MTRPSGSCNRHRRPAGAHEHAPELYGGASLRVILIAVLAIVLGIAAAPAAEPSGIPLHEASRALPEIGFTDEAGVTLSLEAWRGRVVLLNIWATWCGPCRAEMPTLDRLQGRLASESFEVVALSIDRAGVAAVRAFYDEIDIKHLAIYIDETGQVAQDLGMFGLPSTILVGPDGRELGRLIGPAEWDAPEMIAFFESTIETNEEGD